MPSIEFPYTLSAIGALDVALDALSGEFLQATSPSDLGARCVSLQHARQRLDGLIATGIAAAERAGVAVLAGQRTMAQFLASRTHASPDAARADSRLGLWVEQFSELETAMLDGRLSRQHADLLRRSQNIRVFSAMQRDQTLFLDAATTLEWKSFTNAVKYWLLVNDPDGPEPEDHEAHNTCSLSERPSGRVRVTADLDPRSGATLIEQIGNEENILFDLDQRNGTVRTATERRAAAFANLIDRGAGRTEATSKPLIHIVMSLQVLLHALAQLAKDPHEQDFTSVLDANDPDGRCELANGTPIHPKYALVLLMQARIRRQVLGAKSNTLNASQPVRAFPTWMKHIKLVESRGQCETAGCDAMVQWLQADHHKPRSSQGETALHNLKMLCAPDNKYKSSGPPLAERRAPTAEAEQTQAVCEG